MFRIPGPQRQLAMDRGTLALMATPRPGPVGWRRPERSVRSTPAAVTVDEYIPSPHRFGPSEAFELAFRLARASRERGNTAQVRVPELAEAIARLLAGPWGNRVVYDTIFPATGLQIAIATARVDTGGWIVSAALGAGRASAGGERRSVVNPAGRFAA